MAKQVSCPGCRTVYKLPDNPQGKPIKVKCKKCDKVFVADKGSAPANTAVQAEKKPAPKGAPKPPSKSSVASRPGQAPARKSKSSFALIIVGLLVLFSLGAGGAVGSYFLFFHGAQETVNVALNKQPIPKTGDGANVGKKEDKVKPAPDPKEKKVEPAPDPKEKKADPVPDPKEKKVDPVPDPKEKKVDPVPDPKEKKVDPVPDPKEVKVDPVPDPKEKKVEPAPPVVAGLYKLKDPPTPPAEIKLPEAAAQIVLTPDGKTAVVSRNALDVNERNIQVVELPSGKILKNVPIPGLKVSSMVLSPDAKFVHIGGNDDRFNVQPKDRVYIWTLSLTTGKYVGVIKGPSQGVEAMALSPDGNLLACAESNFIGSRGCVRVLYPKTGVTLFYKEKIHQNQSKGIGLTRDKKYVISAGTDDGGRSKVVVFDLAAKAEKFIFAGFPGIVEGLAVSADGKLVAAAFNAGNGGSVRVWDIETGAEKLALTNNNGRGAAHVVFGPEDKTILATFYDASTRTFNLETGHEEGGFRGHSITPNILAKTPDGKTVVTAYFKDLNVWQFPDSLKKLGMPDQPAFVEIVRDGKAVAGPPVFVKEEQNFQTFVNVTVEAIVEERTALAFTLDGAPAKVWLRPEAKYLDIAGKPVAAEDAKQILRLGNVVNIKTKKEFKSPVVEIRLVKEGPAEITVENAKYRGSGVPVFIFASAGKDLPVRLAAKVSYVDHEGKAISNKEGKFFNDEDIYALKLKLVTGEDLPILSEIRLTPAKGQLPVFLKYPLGVIGARVIKNAVVKNITVSKTTEPHLVVAGEEPLPFFGNNETKTYDMKGDPATQNVFQPDMKVDLVIVPRGKSNLVLEARALTPYPAPPPVVKKLVEFKDVAITLFAGNNKQASLKGNTGKSFGVEIDPNLKGFNKEGKPIAAAQVLKTGNRIDAKVEEAGPDRILIEASLVDEPIAPGRKNFESLEVMKGGGNVFTLKMGAKTINVLAFKETKFFDADGKPTTAEQVLRVGNTVDVLMDYRGNPKNVNPLLEARPTKK